MISPQHRLPKHVVSSSIADNGHPAIGILASKSNAFQSKARKGALMRPFRKSSFYLTELILTMLTLAVCSIHGQQAPVTANVVISDLTQLQQKIGTLGSAGGTIVIASNATGSISGNINISTPIAIFCMPGAIIAESGGSNPTGSLFVITGQNFLMQNCTVSDPFTTSGYAAFTFKSSSSNFTLTNNIITGQIHMEGATQGLFQGNTITGNIFGEMNTSYIRAIGNYITTPANGGSSLQFHGSVSGDTVSHISVTGNHLLAGDSFCVEIGAFGSGTVPPVDIIVANNICDRLTNAVAGSGGYSFDSVISPVIANNVFDLNGQTITNTGIEIVNSYYDPTGAPVGSGTGAIVRGNTLNGAGISINKQSNNLIEGNYINMGSALNGVYVTGSYSSTNNYNQIRNNTIICGSCYVNAQPPNQIFPKMIWLQAVGSTSTVIGNQITGNLLVGAGQGEYGVWLQAGSTAPTPVNFDQTVINDNIFTNVSNDIHPQANTEYVYLYRNACTGTSWIPTSLPAYVYPEGTDTTSCSINH